MTEPSDMLDEELFRSLMATPRVPVLNGDDNVLWIMPADIIIIAELLNISERAAFYICERCYDSLVSYKVRSIEEDKAKYLGVGLKKVAEALSTITDVMTKNPAIPQTLYEYSCTRNISVNPLLLGLRGMSGVAQMVTSCAASYSLKKPPGQPRRNELVLIVTEMIMVYEKCIGEKVTRQVVSLKVSRVVTPFEEFAEFMLSKVCDMLIVRHDKTKKRKKIISEQIMKRAIECAHFPARYDALLKELVEQTLKDLAMRDKEASKAMVEDPFIFL